MEVSWGKALAQIATYRWFACAPLTAAAFALARRSRHAALARRRDRRIRLELEAYARFELPLRDAEHPAEAAFRLCQLVASHSAFQSVALITRDLHQGPSVAASLGMHAPLLAALTRWAEQSLAPARPATQASSGPRPPSTDPRTEPHPAPRTTSGPTSGPEPSPEPGPEPGPSVVTPPIARWTRHVCLHLGGRDLWLAPLWTTSGRMSGALVLSGPGGPNDLVGVEALAAKLARTFENAALADRLLRSEKLAGLGQLAGGVAHALNNPLTAVMGYAELIAETTSEPRIQEDAATILREAARMRETVQSLLDLWRPAILVNEPVSLTHLVQDLAQACREKLTARNVRLILQLEDPVAPIRGSRDRIRLVMEHLLNNAAQAIAVAADFEPDSRGHAIRLSVRQDERGVQVIVGDTGPGFPEPTRVFDPLYTTQHVDQGAGLGLSICYGIVREHGGEISAFNLHPRGAAIVIELPLTSATSNQSPLAAEPVLQ